MKKKPQKTTFDKFIFCHITFWPSTYLKMTCEGIKLISRKTVKRPWGSKFEVWGQNWASLETWHIKHIIQYHISTAQYYSSHQFSTPRNIFAVRLEHNKNFSFPNLPFWGGKMAQNTSKMGKITIFPKLTGLECSFDLCSYPPIFHPTESIYNSFKHFRLLVTPQLGLRGQNKPRNHPKWVKSPYFRN